MIFLVYWFQQLLLIFSDGQVEKTNSLRFGLRLPFP